MPDYGGGSTYKGGSGYTTKSQASSGGSKASQRRKKAARAAEARAKKALADQKKADAAKAISSLGMTGATKAIADQQKAAAALAAQRAVTRAPEVDPGAIAAQQAAARAEAQRVEAAAQTTFGQQAAANQQAAAQRAAAAQAAAAAAAREANVGYGAPPPRQAPEIDPRVIASQQAAARQEQARFAAQQAAQQAAAQRAAAAQAAANQQKSNAIAQIRAAEQAQMGSVKPKPRPSVTNDQGPLQKAYNDFLMDIGVRDKTQDYYDRMSDRKDAAKKEQDRLRDKRFRDRDRDRARSDTTIPPKPDITGDPGPGMPPELVDEFPFVYPPVMPPQFPQYPGYGGGMMGGIGAFGYNPALMAFESQQGAGQVPYYMAAARNAQTPNMSPAFMHAARNYDILGGSQRTAPRPMEMMSAAERAQIASIGSNFNTPNYNSPYYQPSPRSEFDFFKRMVGDGGTPEPRRPLMEMFPEGPPTRFGGPGKGAPRSMPQDQSKAVAGGLAALMNSGMFG